MKSVYRALFLFALAVSPAAADMPPADEVRAIAKEGYVFGFPMVMGYKLMYAYAIDESSPEFEGRFNEFGCEARVYTPDDRAVVRPNSDTPYCMNWLDLSAEPLVLTVPGLSPDRYYSFQLIDLNSHNFAYIGTLTTGNEPGRFLLAGPGWDGAVPEGITDGVHSETNIVFSVGRTQAFGADDVPAVRQIQEGYRLQPLGDYTKQPKPPARQKPEVPKWVEGAQFDERFFTYLDVVLSLLEPVEQDKPVRDRLAGIGVGAGDFDLEGLSPEVRAALKAGVDAGLKEIEDLLARITSDPLASVRIFGTRDFLEASAQKHYEMANPYLIRAGAAHIGLYGNSAAEALYPTYKADSTGQPLDGAQKRYRIVFKGGEPPPVKAFWSITMYDGETQLLADNPIDRYLLNSTMEDDFVEDADGSVAFYIQADSPGDDLEPNWLPAPEGPFYVVMRLYGPTEEVLAGGWSPPHMEPNESGAAGTTVD
jgi:hypothetical protein